jgi:hypothetical protein
VRGKTRKPLALPRFAQSILEEKGKSQDAQKGPKLICHEHCSCGILFVKRASFSDFFQWIHGMNRAGIGV